MKKLISVITLIVILLSTVATVSFSKAVAIPEMKYSDVFSDKWYYESVKYVSEKSLMVGTSDTEFSPNEKLSRAMLVTVLWRIEGSPDITSVSFADVPKGKWYSKAIAWAYKNNIVAGISKDEFAPNDPVTREQMAAIFMRYAGYLLIDTTARHDISTFADAKKISKWAKDAFSWAYAELLLFGVGNNKVNPLGKTTRAEAAAMLERFCKNILAYAGVSFGNKTVSNYHGAVANSDEDFKKVEQNATKLSLYNNENSPILSRDRQVNRGVMPSFDIDNTAFVRSGTRISDLKNKTLHFFTADCIDNWSYRDNKGQRIDEWQWFKLLKDEIGLSVKFTIKQNAASINAALAYMNAGLQCDLMYTNRTVFPQALCVSKPITQLINFNQNGSSPGVSWAEMQEYMWGHTLRIIAPIGPADMLWYNEEISKTYSTHDPHAMWLDDGSWDENSFDWILKLVSREYTGVTLTADEQMFVEGFCVNMGTPIFENLKDEKIPTVKKNISWAHDMTRIIMTNEKINFSHTVQPNGKSIEYLGLFKGTTFMSTSMSPDIFCQDYSTDVKLTWVPYPTKSYDEKIFKGMSFGCGMMLPRKTAKPENENITVKFMELWATRFTESFYDNLATHECFEFDFAERKEYFEFVSKNMGASFAGSIDFKNYGNLVEIINATAPKPSAFSNEFFKQYMYMEEEFHQNMLFGNPLRV